MRQQQLFSFDPERRPKCACPNCGWQTFWQHENCIGGCPIRCERCRISIFPDQLTEPKGVQ